MWMFLFEYCFITCVYLDEIMLFKKYEFLVVCDFAHYWLL